MSETLPCTRCKATIESITVGSVAICYACGQTHLLAFIPFDFKVVGPYGLDAASALSSHESPASNASSAAESTPVAPVDHLTPEGSVSPLVVAPQWAPGDRVVVQWRSRLLDAEIVRVVGPDQWEVKYVEWDNDLETVGSDRIQSPPPAITAETSLALGLLLKAEWEGKWYDAEVIGLEPEGDVKVHYVGEEARWDQVLPRERLRLVAG